MFLFLVKIVLFLCGGCQTYFEIHHWSDKSNIDCKPNHGVKFRYSGKSDEQIKCAIAKVTKVSNFMFLNYKLAKQEQKPERYTFNIQEKNMDSRFAHVEDNFTVSFAMMHHKWHNIRYGQSKLASQFPPEIKHRP